MSATANDASVTLMGIDQVTLQRWLSDAQAAYAQLMTGARAVQVSFGAGDGGHKAVSYTRTNAAQLLMWIQQLQQALGNVPPRRVIGVRFMR